MSDFLSGLSGVLSQQFSIGENKLHSLDISQNGYTQRFGRIGDFAKQIDQSADRSYVESGYTQTNPFNPKPNSLEILLQDPDMTVLVKKRFASSLAENYRSDIMDKQEALFFKATKILFQNKCAQISAYEKLCKIERVSTAIGRVDHYLLPMLFSATDTISNLSSNEQTSANQALSGFKSIVDRVREITAMSQDNKYTTWVTNIPDSFRSSFGEGTGVIEFTNVTTLSTTTTLQFAAGSFNMTFSDPYNLMLITNVDIEKALSDAANSSNLSYIQFGITALDDTIAFQKNQLNSLRTQRRVNPIIFIANADTFLGKRVRALIDNVGFEIQFDGSSIGSITGTNTIDPSAKQGSDQIGNEGLNDAEISLFNTIVSMLYNQISIVSNSRRSAIAVNQDPTKGLNAVRKRLRLHYANKLVIQPMDNVHVYINSKKKVDAKITGGLQSNFSALGFLQGVNNLTREVKDAFNVLSGYSIEKSIFVGNDFPTWLWMIMRSQIVSDQNGIHTFAGIVNEATSSYSGGMFSVRVSGFDNAGYFKFGVVNFKPSVDVFNGALYDPLTPFKLEFDSVSGVQKNQSPVLLDENKGLFQSAFVKDKSGLLAGAKSSEKAFLTQDADRSKNNSMRRVFYDPDGMVYRWKEGIATLVLFGDSYEANPIGSQGTAITDDPFAGQDVMNVLSLLITGEPYNFATFYKSAIKFDTFKRDSTTNEAPSNSYFRGLQSQLKYKNAIYGNFIPFKSLSIDEKSFAKILDNQLNAIAYDDDLKALLQKRADLSDKLAFVSGKINTSTDQDVSTALKAIDDQIQKKTNSIYKELNSINKPIRVVGDDISFDADISDTAAGRKNKIDDNQRRDLRRKLAFLTRRLAWKVRANEDTNFLIVDDSYDKDYDIQAFEKSFASPALFRSEYITVADKIENVRDMIRGLEVFANTQGHIEIRNPQYNRVPSSVFYAMLRKKTDTGIQIFPQFIEDLFINQVNELFTAIEVLEDEIRLYCVALGKVTDNDGATFINSFDQGVLTGINKLNGNIGGFTFLSNSDNGFISGDPITLTLLSKPGDMLNYVQTKLSKIEPQTSINVFSVIARSKFLQSIVFDSSNQGQSQTDDTRVTKIIARLLLKSGQTFDMNQLFSNTDNSSIKTKNVSSLDLLNIANSIATRISARQRAIKQAADGLKNIKEGVKLFKGNDGIETGANSLLAPDLFGLSNIPKVFEHMIEDESYDDIGVGSASRYIIKNRDIISDSITEKRPPFTSIEVNGRFGDQFIKNNQLPQDLHVFKEGNALITAAAVDYDMWRMYGMSLPSSIDAPYLTNPETQCAPYAVSLLNAARKQILGGTIDIVGNEYQQPGEVVYLEYRDLLCYVESITHNFTFGRAFTTSMAVSYIHNPGEYIPTWMDVIGKVLYKNKDITKYVHKRQGSSFNQEHIGTIIGNYQSQSGTIEDDITDGPAGEVNRNVLNKILDYAATTLSLSSETTTPSLELRVYYNSANSNFKTPNTYALKLADTIRAYLIGSNDLHGNAKPTGSTKNTTSSLSQFVSQIPLPSKVTVDGNPKTTGENRYPSSKAFSAARNIVKSTSSQFKSDQDQIDNAIYNFIVDCWIVFKKS